MTSTKDLSTWYELIPVTPENSTTQLGTLLIEYQARRFTDVRNLTVRRGYHITCSQRLIMPNDNIDDFGPNTVSSYSYPAMVISEITLNGSDAFYLVDYTPKTLNSAVTSSQSGSVANNVQSSTEHTSGSSTSQTNTFEFSANAGIFAGDFTGGVSDSYSTSTTHEHSTSDSTGASRGSDVSNATSDSMSIKDWGSFATVDASNQNLRWFWGQQYPWDVLTYHNVDPKSGDIVLPSSVVDLLYDPVQQQVFPPCQLSLFGINLVSKATWLCLQPSGAPDETVSFTHTLFTFTGTHGTNGTNGTNGSGAAFSVRLTVNPDFSWTSPQLSLAQLALNALPGPESDVRSTVGFVLSQFTFFGQAPPPEGGDQFSIRSPANNLLVTGTGFNAPASNDAPMTASFADTGPASETEDLSLYLKQWKTTPLGCTISIAINDNPAIVRHVDSLEAGSGTDNILRVMLRNTDYTSPEFYDYVVMGLNKITLSISGDPVTPQQPSGYAIRAVAIA
ncbi:MAG: hypothetical protein ABSA53_24960 [Streptosporangiaceae bacterium]